MTDPQVKMGKDYSETCSAHPCFGCLDVPTPNGTFHVHDGQLTIAMKVDHPCGHQAVALMVCSTVAPATTVQGLVAQFDPREAREFAASLLDCANQIDGGKGDA